MQRLGSELVFNNINRSDAGQYRCEASNECGNAATATIEVRCKYHQSSAFNYLKMKHGQRAKKVMSDSLWLVDFAVGLVDSPSLA